MCVYANQRKPVRQSNQNAKIYVFRARHTPRRCTQGEQQGYFEDYLYDLEKDPNEKTNLIKSPEYAEIRQDLKYMLIDEMKAAGEEEPVILPALWARKK